MTDADVDTDGAEDRRRRGREPLDAAALQARLIGPGRFVTTLNVTDQTTSTNADLLIAAAQGAPEVTVLVAEFQTAGRGRFDRVWTSPPRAGLTVSILLRPDGVPPARWGWLPLLSGVALRAAVQSLVPPERAGQVVLKWPNDLLIGASGRKGAGILAQAADGAVVVGLGVNVDHLADELPGERAGSLRTEFGPGIDRAELLVSLLDELAWRYRAWCAVGGDPDANGPESSDPAASDPATDGLRAEYEAACATLGAAIEVVGAQTVQAGIAVAINADGGLVVQTADGTRTVSAGDIVHVRPAAR